jgi:hypothetical protein
MGYTVTQITAQYQKRNNIMSNMLMFLGRFKVNIAKQTIYKATLDVSTLENIWIQCYNNAATDVTFTVSIDGASQGTVVISNGDENCGTVDVSGDSGNKELKIEVNTTADDSVITNITIMHQEA